MKELKAQAGNWLTQQTLTDETSRTFATSVYTPDASLWQEVSNDYKEQWEKEHPAPLPPDMPAESAE